MPKKHLVNEFNKSIKQDNFILLKFVLNLHEKDYKSKKYDLYQQIKTINTDIISN